MKGKSSSKKFWEIFKILHGKAYKICRVIYTLDTYFIKFFPDNFPKQLFSCLSYFIVIFSHQIMVFTSWNINIVTKYTHKHKTTFPPVPFSLTFFLAGKLRLNWSPFYKCLTLFSFHLCWIMERIIICSKWS